METTLEGMTTMLKVIPSNRNSVHITLWMNMQLINYSS
uniref:Uncharacterized protein n=1 Tax=Podoviridae sp. ct8Lf7 TaxID=2827723 RepID=A0A8S5S0M0_9CAUD|nr:MAG TPA: hypothetical protein [Podoviridae sp. ct8Lf7]